ncbi:Detected protein of confused Function [Hibiscus syriacus]|uniref:Detected protein of confused Function n=1 Tax=Hibiscus syriacus TaxID=106335 RepID=A0A6A3C0U4_HIBSY|nr:Detected protein of confused Function [Hibiscus syriacus]
MTIEGTHSRRTPSVGIAFWQRISSTSSQFQSGTGLLTRSVSAFQKAREWSEIVAAPRWKTFIRRFNRNKSGSSGRHGRFRYDPLSYALNFDKGQIGDSEDANYGYGGFRAFSVRYASVSPGSVGLPVSNRLNH